MDLFEIFTFSLIPFALSLIGSFIALKAKMTTSWSAIIQHFVAGVVLGVVAIELMPEILHTDSPLTTTIGFFLGVAIMILLHALGHFIAKYKVGSDLPLGAIFAASTDLFIDGIILALAFIAGPESGFLVAISLSFCAFFLTLSIGTMLRRKFLKMPFKIAILGSIGLCFVLGALLGAKWISLLPGNYMIEMLSLGTAALLYLGVEELLVEAHKVRDKIWTPGLFFLGFWLVLLFKCIN